MTALMKSLLGASALTMLSLSAYAETTLTIATVNNGDMIRMQKLTDDFTQANPDIKLNWVTLEENVLRQKVTTDIATKGGQFDVLTIGTYEVPIWGKKGWLVPLDNLGADYDVDDLLPAIRSGLTVDGKLYAAPFYGESSLVMYRKDLMDKAGLKMPDAPTWKFIKRSRRQDDRQGRRHLWHLPARQGRLGREHGVPDRHRQFVRRALVRRRSGSRSSTRPNGRRRSTFMSRLMKADGPPGASSNGFNENLALFNSGKCGMWIDATVAASFVTGKDSTVADKVGFALAPDDGLGKRGNWLWAWSLAIPAGSAKVDAAEKFVSWATDKALYSNSSPRRRAGPTSLRERAPRSTRTRTI